MSEDHSTGSAAEDGGRSKLLQEFDGTSPNGRWDRVEPVEPVFRYEVTPTALEMYNSHTGLNQHLVRQGVEVDPNRPYAIECDFRIGDNEGITSFALHLNIAPDDFGPSARIHTWTVNMDLKGPVSKAMGFVDGAFHEVPGAQQSLPFATDGIWYHARVEVNRRLDGTTDQGWVVARFLEEGAEHAAFERNYNLHAYTPDYTRDMRIGVGSHFARWTMKHLQVYYLD